MHDELKAELPVWRLWLEGKLPLADMDRVSIDDVDDAIYVWRAWEAARE